MNVEEALQILDTVVFNKVNRHLKDVEIIILKGSWQGLNYDEIANNEGYTAKYLRQDVGFKLWKLLSEALGEEVNKTNFRAAVERSHLRGCLKSIRINRDPPNPPYKGGLNSSKSPFSRGI